MSPQVEIYIIAVLAAVACAIPGVFLVLRRMSMMADAITHTVFLGIVLAFFATEDLNSPWLLLGAAIVGVLTVWCTEALYRTKLVAEDASIGVVFPLLFSAGIVLVNLYSGNAHLDVDTALLGELAFAPFDRVILDGVDWGPASMWTLAFVCVLNLVIVLSAYKEFKLSAFDSLLAAFFGFSPVLLHYLLMTMVSVTVVASFRAVGAILVIGLMIGPPAIAYLLTSHLSKMMALSILIGAGCAWLGTWLAFYFDVSIAGAIAATIGALFILVVSFAPRVGFVAKLRIYRTLRIRYGEDTMLFHLLTHENTEHEREECGVGSVHEHLRWKPEFAVRIYRRLEAAGLVKIADSVVHLTEQGRERAIVTSEQLFTD